MIPFLGHRVVGPGANGLASNGARMGGLSPATGAMLRDGADIAHETVQDGAQQRAAGDYDCD